MPVICGLYVLSYLDRGNIGNAKAAGAQTDLGLSDSQWAWVLNAFYVCYVCFEWTTIMWKILPAHIYISALCVLYVSLVTYLICVSLIRKQMGNCCHVLWLCAEDGGLGCLPCPAWNI